MLSGPALAARLPDLPRWVEVRDLLLADEGEITGFLEGPGLSLILKDQDSLFVIGTPSPDAVRMAARSLSPGGHIVVPPERSHWLGEILGSWTSTRLVVHTLRNDVSLPTGEVAFLDPTVLGRFPVDAELLEELRLGARHSPIAAVHVDQRPVSFCYAGATTESLWDVAIDTFPDHRRRGYAANCAAFMIRHMLAQGKHPVWQSLEDNPASWRLAEKLGFVAIDELVLLTRVQEGE